MKEIKVIGITGNIGSGKTTAAQYVESLNHKVLYSDNIAKQLLQSDNNVKNKIIDYFGDEAYLNSEYNLSFISKKVFGNSKENKKNLEKLNSIIHPAVIENLMQEIEFYANEGLSVIFIESALIFELALEEGFDYVINIFCNDDIAIERIIKRNNISEKEAKTRLDSQFPSQTKKQLADFTIINESTLVDLYNSINKVLLFIL